VQVASGAEMAQRTGDMRQHPAPQTAKARSANQGLTVWHDGACPLCAREIAVMRRLDRAGRIRFVDAADPSASCPLDRATMLARIHAMEDGAMLSGAAAFAAMWRAIPWLRPLGLAAQWPPVGRALEAAYRAFLRLRPRLQAWLR
jgi:predicted DCC family thiol-disulfide oxidoreductase YuxK